MFIVSHYKSNYDWVKEYTDSFIVYHKDRVNVGYNISSMLTYIIDNYDHLPEICVFVKDNILERHITKREFDLLIENKTFTPLLTQNHETDGVINRYTDGIYEERNDGWYFNSYPSKYLGSYDQFAYMMDLPSPEYLSFAPGGNYIVPRGNILKRPKEFYQQLLGLVSWSQINAESHCVERALHTIWS
jgi:hypothetical protein